MANGNEAACQWVRVRPDLLWLSRPARVEWGSLRIRKWQDVGHQPVIVNRQAIEPIPCLHPCSPVSDVVAVVIDPHITRHAPARVPGVLDQPGMFAIVPTDQRDAVIDSMRGVMLIKDSGRVGLEGGRRTNR